MTGLPETRDEYFPMATNKHIELQLQIQRLLRQDEKLQSTPNQGTKRTSLPAHWVDVAKVVIQYTTGEGRYAYVFFTIFDCSVIYTIMSWLICHTTFSIPLKRFKLRSPERSQQFPGSPQFNYVNCSKGSSQHCSVGHLG